MRTPTVERQQPNSVPMPSSNSATAAPEAIFQGWSAIIPCQRRRINTLRADLEPTAIRIQRDRAYTAQTLVLHFQLPTHAVVDLQALRRPRERALSGASGAGSRSAQDFAARRRSSDVPVLVISNEDKARTRSTRMGSPSSCRAASARVRSLGVIEERTSMISFLDQQKSPLQGTMSDVDSGTSSQTSGDATPPSFRHRRSVLVAATSVTSAIGKLSAVRPLPSSTPFLSSWMDCDSDCEEDEMHECNIVPLSPRPPAPLESDFDSGTIGLSRPDIRGSPGCSEPFLRHEPHSVSIGSPISRAQQRVSRVSCHWPVMQSKTVGFRRRAYDEARVGCQTLATKPSIAHIEHISTHQTRRTNEAAQQPSLTLEIGDKPNFTPAPEVVVGREAVVAEMDFPARPLSPRTTTSFTEIIWGRPLYSHPTLRSVQSWLDRSLQPCPRTFNDSVTRVVPLPPDAMETLRVSIACFPETMLLSSSLTIETIRTYSRKVRQPGLKILRGPLTRATTPETTSQRSKMTPWRKVVPLKRNSTGAGLRQRESHRFRQGSMAFAGSPAVATPKPWKALQNVFGAYSSYICDALYAHIVAYNYMSALVSRSSTTSVLGAASSECEQEDIPKKAAKLLGWAFTDEAGSASNRLSRWDTTSLGRCSKDEIVAIQPTASAKHENMLGGLLHCIMRLVATAKLMNENGTSDEILVDAEVGDADLVLIRSLCEIVRMAEEESV